MPKALHPDQRRRQLMDRLDSAAFWTCIGVAIGVIALLIWDSRSL
jgi:hypothetical protein